MGAELNRYRFECSLDMGFVDDAHGVVFVKRDIRFFSEQLLAESNRCHTDIRSLLFSIEIQPGNEIIESVKGLLANVLEPYLASLAQCKFDDDKAKGGIPLVLQSMQALKLSLHQSQQCFQIPDVNLLRYIHPLIQKITDDDKPISELGNRIRDQGFIKALSRSILYCTEEINKLAQQGRDYEVRGVLEEINFWNAMCRVLESIDLQLKHKSIENTLAVLKLRKSHQAIAALNATDMEKLVKSAKEYSVFLRDIPIQRFLAAMSLYELQVSVSSIFQSFNKLKSLAYPICRAGQLVVAISREFSQKMLDIIQPLRLADMRFTDFDLVSTSCVDVFEEWNDNIKNFERMANEIAMKKRESLLDTTFRQSLEHTRLESRISQFKTFRREHEELLSVITKIFTRNIHSRSDSRMSVSSFSVDILEEVNGAFEDICKNVRLLDLSLEGEHLWQSHREIYLERIERVETIIIKKLRDTLGAASNSMEMLRIFQQFNVLFFRAKVSSAIQEYQAQLVSQVKEDVKSLEGKLKSYKSTDSLQLHYVRGLPSVSGHIIWATQLEKQLDIYLKRVEDVFGNGWEHMLRLRRPNNSWIVGETVSDFIGIPLTKLQRHIAEHSIFRYLKMEVAGTAICLGFLDLVYAHSKHEWGHLAQLSHNMIAREQRTLNINADFVDEAIKMLSNLGVGSRHVQENDLRIEGERIRKMLHRNIESRIRTWCEGVKAQIHNQKWRILNINPTNSSVSLTGPIFHTNMGEESYELCVNFDTEISTVAQEVRLLSSMHMNNYVDHRIISIAVSVSDVQPLAFSLIESVKSFTRTIHSLDEDVRMLGASHVQDMYRLIADGFNLQWKHVDRLSAFTKELADAAMNFEIKVKELEAKDHEVKKLVELLRTCPIEESQFVQHVTAIQHIVDHLSLEWNDDRILLTSRGNLRAWANRVNQNVETALADRLKQLIELWTSEFRSFSSNNSSKQMTTITEKSTGGFSLFAQLATQPITFKLQMYNHEMQISPSLDQARVHWHTYLHLCLSWICNIRTIHHDTFNVIRQNQQTTYHHLLGYTPQDSLFEAYSAIESKIAQAAVYMQTWLQHQSLWRINLPSVFEKLGNDLQTWLQLLLDLNKSRAVLNTKERTMDMGTIIVNFEDVHMKITMRYDEMLRDMLLRFRNELSSAILQFFEEIRSTRHTFEALNIESSISDAVMFINRMQIVNSKSAAWPNLIDIFLDGERILQENRIKLPQNWIYAENVKGEWSAFNEVKERRISVLNKLRGALVQHVVQDSLKLQNRITQFIDEWRERRPLDGTMQPEVVLDTINVFEQRAFTLKKEMKEFIQAKIALGIDLKKDEMLDVCIDEVQKLKNVWSHLQITWERLHVIRRSKFVDTTPSTLRLALDEQLQKIRQLSPWMQQYESVVHAAEYIQSHMIVLPIFKDLRSEMMKSRHWIDLQKKIDQPIPAEDKLTVGCIIDLDLKKHETSIREILYTAQGELGLETFLQQVRDHWANYEFDLANYGNKCFLVRGWDTIFDTIHDHYSSLEAMKTSPFFKPFTVEHAEWNRKINKIRTTCDVWVDVQRMYVYLEDIMMNSADIQYQLPTESKRFQVLNADFIKIMHEVRKTKFVLEIVELPHLVETLEVLRSRFQKIQRSLGEYLEQQRAVFPRFYFVGDEDLLEIIGSGSAPEKIQKHLRKMFAGIHSLIFDDKNDKETQVLGMISKEGERVIFENSIALVKNTAAEDWLRRIESEMKETLAMQVEHAIPELEHIYDSAVSLDSDNPAGELVNLKTVFIEWIERYSSQIVVVSSQVVWTSMTERLFDPAHPYQADPNMYAKFSGPRNIHDVLNIIDIMLEMLVDFVVETGGNCTKRVTHKKIEHLITELVHQRDTIRGLIAENVCSLSDFDWLRQMRFYFDYSEPQRSERLVVRMANASFVYGFEYLGVGEKLVQTPLTDQCWIVLTQALHSRLGGNPFGPAGTGKTESVKALAAQLGRQVGNRFFPLFC